MGHSVWAQQPSTWQQVAVGMQEVPQRL
jgi:hypothetical protein